MPNQWKPCPPPDTLKEHASKYFHQGASMRKMVQLLKRHYDTDTYGLGYSTLKKYYAQWGLESARMQGHTLETIDEPIQTLRVTRPNVGSTELRHLMRSQMSIRVAKQRVLDYLNLTEREAVLARKGKAFVRRQYLAPGVNFSWSIDQHDKLKWFGLRFHVATECYSGKLIWLVVYWTNSNPRWVTHQYVDAVRKYGMPLLTLSDLGSENFGIANAHTSLRQHMDPTLHGTLQHLFMHGHTNIKAEIAWKQFRMRFSLGYEQLFDQELYQAYNPANALQRLLFRWLAVPWMQAELDQYVEHHNNTPRRADRRKVLPHGVPDDIFDHPEDYQAENYGIAVPADALDAAEQQWAPPDHPVFEVVPPAFQRFVVAVHERSGSPKVDFDNFWGIYKYMLAIAEHWLPDLPDVLGLVAAHGNVHEGGENLDMPLIEHEQVAQYGIGGIPVPLLFEERVAEELHSHESEQDRQNDEDDWEMPGAFVQDYRELLDGELDETVEPNRTVQESQATFVAPLSDEGL